MNFIIGALVFLSGCVFGCAVYWFAQRELNQSAYNYVNKLPPNLKPSDPISESIQIDDDEEATWPNTGA
jgi:hypothetical protein